VFRFNVQFIEGYINLIRKFNCNSMKYLSKLVTLVLNETGMLQMNRTKIFVPVSRANCALTFAYRLPDRIGASVATVSVCWLTASPASKPRSWTAVSDQPIPARRNVPTPVWPSNVPVYLVTDWPTISAPVSVRNAETIR
jgi:hypothetical protein